MALSDRKLLDALSRTPFIDSAELALIIGEPHTTVHRTLADLLAEGIVGRVSHGTAHLPSSQRYHLTTGGIAETAWVLGFTTPSDFVRAYPMSREWLTLLIRRMDAVASIYRLAATMSPGIDGLRSHVEFHRRGRFDATITLHDGRSFGVMRQGLALRRRSRYDRLRAIAEYDYSRRPGTVLILVPSVWEERLTTRFCEDRNIPDCYVAVESRDAIERRDLRLWCCTSWVIGSQFFSLKGVISRASPGRRVSAESPERKRASIPNPERMAQAAPAFGLSPSEKRMLDLITDHPMIPREHLATWLGVSEGRVSQMMHSLVNTWGLSGRLEVIKAELSDVRKRLEKLYEAIETSELTLEVLSPRIMSLRHREEQLEAAREDAETQLEQRRVELPDTEEIARYVADFRDFLKDGTIPERKALIRNFVEGIEVMGDEATLTYTVPMPSDGAMSESASVLDFVKSGPPNWTKSRTFIRRTQ